MRKRARAPPTSDGSFRCSPEGSSLLRSGRGAPRIGLWRARRQRGRTGNGGRVPASLVRGTYVPAGQAFTIALGRELSTTTSVSGEPFYATLRSALVGSDGRVIVPVGSTVLGHVDTVTAGTTPHIVLAFDAVQTPSGATPLIARVLDVLNVTQHTGEVERSLLAVPLTARGSAGEGTSIAPPGAPTTPVLLPAGLLLRLELTRPLFPPGTEVGP